MAAALSTIKGFGLTSTFVRDLEGYMKAIKKLEADIEAAKADAAAINVEEGKLEWAPSDFLSVFNTEAGPTPV